MFFTQKIIYTLIDIQLDIDVCVYIVPFPRLPTSGSRGKDTQVGMESISTQFSASKTILW